MKNKKYFIFLFLLLIIMPVFVYAAVVTTYGEAVTKTNNYISTFRDRRKYLLFGKNYVYEGTTFGDSSAFINGGLLSKSEFDLSVYSNQSYLANGKEYWTLTSAGSNKKYYVDAFIQSKSADSLSGTRVTEYIKPGTIFGGKGTYANPWTFEEGYAVDIISNNTSYGTVSPLGERYVRPGESLEYVLTPENGYYYNKRKDECGLIKMGANVYENNYIIENIKRDITCTAVFELRTYIFDLAIKDSDKDYRSTKKTYATQPNPKLVYFKYRTNWYSDHETKHVINSITKPAITGWTFNGYYYGSVQVIDANGNFTSDAKNLNLGGTRDFVDVNHTLYASITKNTYTITYNLNGGTFGTLHPTSGTYDEIVEIDNPSKAGKQFAGWTFNGNTTTAKTGSASNDVTTTFNAKSTNRYFVNLNPTKNSTVTMTANWEDCPAGTYNDGTSPTCSTCPAGTYNIGTGNTTCTPCEDGYYCGGGTDHNACPKGKEGTGTGKTTEANGCQNCAAGKYADEEGLASCKNCAANHYSTGGAVTCDSCPGSMTSPAQSQSITACTITCAGGTYLKKGEGTCSDCPTGSYCEGGVFNYNASSNQGIAACTSLASNYTSSAAKSDAAGDCYIPKSNLSGKYVATARANAVTCAAGGYCPGTTDIYYGNTGGRTQCNAGKYNASTGSSASSACANCTAGYYCTAGSTSATQHACTAGNYCPAGSGSQTSCTSLNSNYTSSGAVSTKAGDCYIPKSNLSGKYVATAKSGPSTCTGGYYCPGTSNIYYGNTGGRSGCPGNYTSGSGATSISQCFVSCAANYQVASAGANCSACGSGYASSGGIVYYGNTSTNTCTKTQTYTAGFKRCVREYKFVSKTEYADVCTWPSNSSLCSNDSHIGNKKDASCSWNKKTTKCIEHTNEDGDYYYTYGSSTTSYGLSSCTEKYRCNYDGDYIAECTAVKKWLECTKSIHLSTEYLTVGYVDCEVDKHQLCKVDADVGKTYTTSCTPE